MTVEAFRHLKSVVNAFQNGFCLNDFPEFELNVDEYNQKFSGTMTPAESVLLVFWINEHNESKNKKVLGDLFFFCLFFFSFNCLNSDKAFQCETEQTYKQNKKKQQKWNMETSSFDLSPKIIRLHQTCIRDVFERFVKKI